MDYRNFAAALLFAGLAFASPVFAQGYAGVLPAERAPGAAPDNSALPFMSSQLGAQGSSSSTVTGAADSGGEAGGADAADANYGQGLGDDASAMNEDGEAGDGSAPDMSDLYGLNGDTTLSAEKKANEVQPQTGFMASFSGDKEKDAMDVNSDPLPENMYRAIEMEKQDPGEARRLRTERALKAAEIEHNKEIDAMNAARLRDHQIKAQAELDRVREIQEEAMEKVRAAQSGQTYEQSDEQSGDAQEAVENTGDSGDGTDGSSDSNSRENGTE